MKTCKACKYFTAYTDEHNQFGTCHHPVVKESILIETGIEDYCAPTSVSVAADFGCIYHEALSA